MADTISLFKYTVLLEVDLTQNQLKSFQKPDGAWAWISPMARFPAGFGVLVIKRHDFTATNVAIQSEIPQVSPGRPCLSTWNLVQNLFYNHRFSVGTRIENQFSCRWQIDFAVKQKYDWGGRGLRTQVTYNITIGS